MSDAWERLDSAQDRRFRVQRAALVEYARARLPTRLSRAVVADGVPDWSATPAEIWRRGDDFGLVWHVRHWEAGADAPSRSVVGVLRQPAGQEIEILPREHLGTLPGTWERFEWIDFAGPFWPLSPAPPLSQGDGGTAPPPGPEAAAAADAAPEEAPVPPPAPSPQERLEAVQRTVDAAVAEEWARRTSQSPGSMTADAGPWLDQAAQWRRVADMEERQRVADLLQRARICNFSFDPSSFRMALLAREVPYYRGCRLYRVIDMRGPRSRFTSFVLHLVSADILCLYRESRPIHEFNRRRHAVGELAIDASTATAYLRYFGEFVHGTAGAFSIIELQTDIRWLSVAPRTAGNGNAGEAEAETLKAAIIGAIRPAALYRVDPAPRLFESSPSAGDDAETPAALPVFCRAMVGYGRHLFLAGFMVQADGMVEMLEDVALHDSPLPIQPLNFNLEFQFGLRVDPERRSEAGVRAQEQSHG